MCRSEAQLYDSHLVVSVSSPPPYQHLSELVVLYAVALLGSTARYGGGGS